jgi:hypothetical protein
MWLAAAPDIVEVVGAPAAAGAGFFSAGSLLATHL